MVNVVIKIETLQTESVRYNTGVPVIGQLIADKAAELNAVDVKILHLEIIKNRAAHPSNADHYWTDRVVAIVQFTLRS